MTTEAQTLTPALTKLRLNGYPFRTYALMIFVCVEPTTMKSRKDGKTLRVRFERVFKDGRVQRVRSLSLEEALHLPEALGVMDSELRSMGWALTRDGAVKALADGQKILDEDGDVDSEDEAASEEMDSSEGEDDEDDDFLDDEDEAISEED